MKFERQKAGLPSSPPQIMTTAIGQNFKNRYNGVMPHQKSALTTMMQQQNGTIKPHGSGPTFSYTPSNKKADLSPRSSSPDSSRPSSPTSSTDDSVSPPRSLSSSPIFPRFTRSRLVSQQRSTRIQLGEGMFTVEEFNDSDYLEFDSDLDSVIRPHQYEDAESERALSLHGNDIDTKIAGDFRGLNCDGEDQEGREAWVEAMRAEKRRKRRSSSSVQKRTLSMSIGSDTDDEDLQPVTFDANEAGSSARRLRRRVGERVSLIFDDPPPRIEEEEEGPESVEELFEIDDYDDDNDDKLAKELPYWKYAQVMDMDSDDD